MCEEGNILSNENNNFVRDCEFILNMYFIIEKNRVHYEITWIKLKFSDFKIYIKIFI